MTSTPEQRKRYYEKNKEQLAIKKKEYHEKNKEQLLIKRKKYKEQHRTEHQAYKKSRKELSYQNWLRVLWSNCKLRHTKNEYNSHIICEITLEDLIEKYEEQKGLCAISKVKLEHKQESLNSISIDRIENNLGYTKENVHLVAKWINIGRRNATLDQIKQAIQDVIEANKATVT